MKRFGLCFLVVGIHGLSINPQRVARTNVAVDESAQAPSFVQDRRRFISNRLAQLSRGVVTASVVSTAASNNGNNAAFAMDDEVLPVDPSELSKQVFVRGTVLLPPDMASLPATGASSSLPALYITCRPDRPDNVPSAILSGTRGKSPPVLAARLENPTFPCDFQLTGDNLTIEGITKDGSAKEMDPSKFWWRRENLVVSARWDSDGVAATRSPEDLVGRGTYDPTAPSNLAQVQLTGRGAFGKFATGGK